MEDLWSRTNSHSNKHIHVCSVCGKMKHLGLPASGDLPTLQSCKYHFPIMQPETGVGLYQPVHQLTTKQRTLCHKND